VVNVIRRLSALADERGFAEKWNDSVGHEAVATTAAATSASNKAEAKAKAESDLEQTRAKAAGKFSKDGAVSPRGAPSTNENSAPKEDSTKSQEKLVAKLQVDAKNDADQNSAIHLAIKNRVLLPMLDATNPTKEELNKTNKNKQTPLHIACQQADFDAVEVLVKAGASVNLADDQDKTPLHYAAEVVRRMCLPRCLDVLEMFPSDF
jgi:ankyrin repeat protein